MQFPANLMGESLSNLSAYCHCQPIIDCVYFGNRIICFSAEIRKILEFLIWKFPLKFLWSITKTRIYNFDTLKTHFYVVKLGFTGLNIIFSYFYLKNNNICCANSSWGTFSQRTKVLDLLRGWACTLKHWCHALSEWPFFCVVAHTILFLFPLYREKTCKLHVRLTTEVQINLRIPVVWSTLLLVATWKEYLLS